MPIAIRQILLAATASMKVKILAPRTRATKSHNIKDAEYLVKRFASLPCKVVGDSVYDSEKFYEFL